MKRLLANEREKFRVLLLVILDILIIIAVSLLALLVRFEMHYSAIPYIYIERMVGYMPIHVGTTILLFYFCKMYQSLWRYASVQEVCYIILASMLSTGAQLLVMWNKGLRMPISYHILTFVFLVCFIVLERFAYRVFQFFSDKSSFAVMDKQPITKTMIIGAGESGRMILKEMTASKYLNNKVACIIDDDKNKIGKFLNGVPIVGGQETIVENVKKYGIGEIIVAIPSATAKEKKKILNLCQETNCPVRILPGVYQLIKGEVSISKLRNVEVEDLLGREQIRVDLDGIMGYVKDKIVLVTGGGGSIGSELCRQIVDNQPKQLIIVDIYENNAYEIQQELIRNYPNLNLVVLIASVRNTKRINDIILKYHPDIIYHAAAHKHVPLMENSPNEAIKNNVFGTYKTAKAAGEHGVKKFVLISTDKAVNPTNIMGASKRICEMIVQMLNRHYDTEFVAVRFGNVLGSNGSVIPLFKQQIQSGGPVTVTHPDIIRYFMTISEAVSLVLQAGAYAKGGEIFVLDMGEPVKILDLAKNLIRLSGYIPEEDIAIEFTGLRPGEKLFEELLMDEEGLKQTENELIHIGKPIEFDESVFIEELQTLEKAVVDETQDVRTMVQKIVPTYIPSRTNS